MNDPGGMRTLFGAAVQDVADCGFLTTVQRVGAEAWAATPSAHGWGAVARELVERLGGQMVPTRYAGAFGGCGWKYGAGPMAGNLIDIRCLQSVLAARQAVAEIIPRAERPALPWTVGANARQLLLWAAEPQAPEKSAETLLVRDPDADPVHPAAESLLQYHDCQPGEYARSVMYDCEGYYFNLLRRLPGLRVSIDRHGVDWDAMPLTPDERYKWQLVLEAVPNQKVLRNSLWGAMLGSRQKRLAYKRGPDGRGVPFRVGYGKGGPFRPAAILLGRSAWEMCRLASEEVASVYSTVDSVTLLDSGPYDYRRVPVWDSAGVPYGPCKEGPAKIVACGVWEFAGIPSKPFAKGGREPVAVPRPPLPETLYYRQWL